MLVAQESGLYRRKGIIADKIVQEGVRSLTIIVNQMENWIFNCNIASY